MNQLTRLGLALLTVAVVCGTGCKKKPANITPLTGGGQPAAPNGFVPSSDPIRNSAVPRNTAVPPGNAFNPQDTTGSRGVPFNDPNAQNPNTKAIDGGFKTDSNDLGPRSPVDANGGDRDTLKGDTVYFEYDKSAIKSSEYAKVGAVAEYLKSNTQDDLLVEGHCDERGTEEYNRALGERALAIRERLVNLGVPATRVTTISFGKDRPVDTGHTEDAFSKNRRGEFVLLKSGSASGGSAK